MSKALAIPIAALAAPALAAGLGVIWLSRKGKELWDSLSPSDRHYLAPFGADADRVQLEAATVSYLPLAGIDFGDFSEGFQLPAGQSRPSLPRPRSAPAMVPYTQAQAEALDGMATAAKQLGFEAKLRDVPEGSSVLVLDLDGISQRERQPVLAGRL